MARRGRRFLAVEQFFGQLLARPQAREPDADGAGRRRRLALDHAQAGQADHLPRQVHDAHRLPHVQHEYAALPAFRHRAGQAQHGGLKNQADRLPHRHEEPLHLRMRDRQRPTPLQLAPEQRHHGAGAAQHVAEAHRQAAHAARTASGFIQRLAIHLR